MDYRLPILAACTLCLSCSGNPDEEQVKDCVASFSEAYFNYDLKKALECSTPESRKWISYTASIITDSDISLLRSKDMASVTVGDIELGAGDTTATATVTVCNWLRPDSVETHGSITGEEVFELRAVSRNKVWKVDFRTEDLLRSGR